MPVSFIESSHSCLGSVVMSKKRQFLPFQKIHIYLFQKLKPLFLQKCPHVVIPPFNNLISMLTGQGQPEELFVFRIELRAKNHIPLIVHIHHATEFHFLHLFFCLTLIMNLKICIIKVTDEQQFLTRQL